MTTPTTMSEPAVHRFSGDTGVLEHRTRPFDGEAVQLVRADGDESAPRFTGHAAVFNSRTEIGNPLGWGWFEEIATGTFDKTLAEGDARFLVDHDTALLVARVSAGDLRLTTDGVGLAVDADLDQELTYVRDLTRNLDKRRITGMSFGFYVIREEWSTVEVDYEAADGKTKVVEADLRTITEVRLLEVSAVTFPAYEDTDAGLRKVADEIRTARGIPTPTDSPAPAGTRPAPADEATRDDNSAPAPAETTQGVDRNDERARALAIRYRLPTS